MSATECQAVLLAELLAHIDGAWVMSPAEACHDLAAYEVHVEHVAGLRVALCASHERLVSTDGRHVRSVRLGSSANPCAATDPRTHR